MGSADWMERNLYRRIEVCFPVYDKAMKEEIGRMLALQLSDNVQAVQIDQKGHNIPVIPDAGQEPIQSQAAINTLLTSEMKTSLIHDAIR